MRFVDSVLTIALIPTILGGTCANAQKPAKAAPPTNAPGTFKITRSNLANVASFTVTQTLAPKGGSKLTRIFKVEVKGSKARLDYEDPAIGPVRYVSNEKGVFFYIPGNNSAMKQTFAGGVEGALKVAFGQVQEQLVGAQKVGGATVSGQPTVVYKVPRSGALVYLGKNPGFHLPVKTETSNEGGTSTLLVTDIKLNAPIADTRFALPAGTKVMESGGAATPGALPGLQ